MLFETKRYTIEVGVIGEDKEPQYLVRSKTSGVVEFCNTSLYFVRDWSLQMDRALDVQDWEIAHPGQEYPGDEAANTLAATGNIVPFPGGGGGGRTN